VSNQSETKSGNKGETKKEGERAMELDGGGVGGWRGKDRSGGVRVWFFLTEVNLEEGEEGRIARASKVREIENRK